MLAQLLAEHQGLSRGAGSPRRDAAGEHRSPELRLLKASRSRAGSCGTVG